MFLFLKLEQIFIFQRSQYGFMGRRKVDSPSISEEPQYTVITRSHFSGSS
ncbi:MAG: hypothetical protein LBH67_02600 [Rickettsia sp.]|nr:hypothetical protein [Rickettsia sp.]